MQEIEPLSKREYINAIFLKKINLVQSLLKENHIQTFSSSSLTDYINIYSDIQKNPKLDEYYENYKNRIINNNKEIKNEN